MAALKINSKIENLPMRVKTKHNLILFKILLIIFKLKTYIKLIIGWYFAALEKGNLCYCLNNIQINQNLTNCTVRCSGYHNEICGGFNGFATVYRTGKYYSFFVFNLITTRSPKSQSHYSKFSFFIYK